MKVYGIGSMKHVLVALSVTLLSQHLRADAVTYNEPRRDQSTILLTALTKLQSMKLPMMYSRFSEPLTAYYLRDASFLGRTDTAFGFKNLLRVTFIRSSVYSEVRGETPPPRGHSFVVIFGEDVEPEFYLPIPMPDSASLRGDVLRVREEQYKLSQKAAFKVFRRIQGEQNAGELKGAK